MSQVLVSQRQEKVFLITLKKIQHLLSNAEAKLRT